MQPNPVNSATGQETINVQGTTAPTDTDGLNTVNGMLSNPPNYYFNVHTTVNPGGALRGQPQRADMAVLIGLMSPLNETPPITGSSASAVSSIIALITRDANGNATSGRVIFDANFTGFSEGDDITGYHIHSGVAASPGVVTINTGISAANSVAIRTGGSGNLHYEVEVDLNECR